MNRLHRLLLAIALPAAALTTQVTFAAGATQRGTIVAFTTQTTGLNTTVAPRDNNFPAPSGQIPADWMTLADDTQAITLAIPPQWSDIDTAPLDADDGTQLAAIIASTDLSLLLAETSETFGIPGVLYVALPYADPAATLDAVGLVHGCTDEGVFGYEDPVFVGRIRVATACGDGATTVLQLAATPSDHSTTVYLQIQLTGRPDDAQTLDGLLSTFGLVDTPTADTISTATDASETWTRFAEETCFQLYSNRGAPEQPMSGDLDDELALFEDWHSALIGNAVVILEEQGPAPSDRELAIIAMMDEYSRLASRAAQIYASHVVFSEQLDELTAQQDTLSGQIIAAADSVGVPTCGDLVALA